MQNAAHLYAKLCTGVCSFLLEGVLFIDNKFGEEG